MAQFNCPELGGSGQWMSGGMAMVGDMFNHGLKNTVDNLCAELSNALVNTQMFPVLPTGSKTAINDCQPIWAAHLAEAHKTISDMLYFLIGWRFNIMERLLCMTHWITTLVELANNKVAIRR